MFIYCIIVIYIPECFGILFLKFSPPCPYPHTPYEGNTHTHIRRITVTSSLNKISTCQLKNRGVMRKKDVTPPTPTPFSSRLLDKYLKTMWRFFLHLGNFLHAPPPCLNISWATVVEKSCSVRNSLWQPISQKWGPLQSCTQKRERLEKQDWPDWQAGLHAPTDD